MRYASVQVIRIEIVGVVGDVKITGLDEAVKPVLYYPFRQIPSTFANLVARTNSDPNALANSIRNEVRNLEPEAAILNVRTMDEMIAQTPASFMRRFPALLISIFAGVALLLASIGIYGVVSYSVSQQTHYIGVRMALGARPADILKMVLKQGLVLALLGVGIGVVAALGLMRLLSTSALPGEHERCEHVCDCDGRAVCGGVAGVLRAGATRDEGRSIGGVEIRVSVEGNVLNDLRYGFRMIIKHRMVTCVAVLALGLGIGANTAIFSIINAVVLRPLPYGDPERLVTILHEGSNPVAPANYFDLAAQSQSFEGIAAAQYWEPNLTGRDQPEHLRGLQLTAQMFQVLGRQPSTRPHFQSGRGSARTGPRRRS